MAKAKGIGSKSLKGRSATLTDQKLLKVGNGIPTPVKAINVALSGSTKGGIIPGVQIIAGPSRHFKSLYGLIMCATYLRENPDAIMIFYDNEFGSSTKYFESVGIDPDRVLHIPFTDIEELRSDLTLKLKTQGGLPEDAKFIVFVDSLGNAASVKEIEDAENENHKADMTRAKTMKSLFRIITSKIQVRGVPFVGINHTYKTQEMYSKDVVSGGTGLMYSANDVWIVGKSQETEGSGSDKKITGYTFTINIEKSRRVRDKVKIPVVVKFGQKLSPVTGLFDIGLNLGVITSPNAGYYVREMRDPDTGEVIEDSKRWRRKEAEFNEDFFDELFANSDFEERLNRAYQLESGKLLSGDEELEDDDLAELAGED